MALYDITDELSRGGKIPFEPDCVYVIRSECGNVTLKIDPGVSRDEAARLLRRLADGLCASDNAGENASASAGPDPAPDPVSSQESSPLPGPSRTAVDPDCIAEDIVRWGDGFIAWKMNGCWRWGRWRPDCGEQWGLGGPRPGALLIQRGPFDNFDETLTSLTRARVLQSEHVSHSYGG